MVHWKSQAALIGRDKQKLRLSAAKARLYRFYIAQAKLMTIVDASHYGMQRMDVHTEGDRNRTSCAVTVSSRDGKLIRR